jgi:septum formation protein
VTALVLASRSPQRRAILAALGVDFVAHAVDLDEREQGPAVQVARENAERKALAAAREHPGATVVGADTVVALDGELFGKPAGEDDAGATLRRLSGRTHEVVGGLAVAHAGRLRTVHEITRVTFREIDDALAAWYVATGEWRGRAGGYAIQERGGVLVRRIDGEYSNVVGLPLAGLLELVPGLLPRG